MATLTCTTRGCMKTTSDSVLDESTNEVICSECGQPITGITDFTKRSMKGMGKVKKTESKTSFSIDCPKCHKRGQPILKNDNAFCAHCNELLKLSKPFIITFKDYLKNSNNESK